MKKIIKSPHIKMIDAMKSINHLPFDGLCVNFKKHDDKLVQMNALLSCFDYLDLQDFVDSPEIVLAILTRYAVGRLLDDLSLTFESLDKEVTKIYFSIYSVDDKHLAMIATNRLRMSRIYDQLKVILEDAKYIIPNTEIYKTYGVHNRQSYKGVIDLIFVDSRDRLGFLSIGTTKKGDYALHPKFLFCLDYLIEAGLKVSYAYVLSIDHFAVRDTAYFHPTTITKHVRSILARNSSMQPASDPNIHYCAICPYIKTCTTMDYV